MAKTEVTFAAARAEVEERDVAVARELMSRMNTGNLDGPADAEGAGAAAAEPSPRPPRSGPIVCSEMVRLQGCLLPG